MKSSLPAVFSVVFLLAPGSAKAQVEDLVFLTFDPAPANPGDIAMHPDVDNILPWVNGSNVGPFSSLPVLNFNFGYAELTQTHGAFGYQWGFEGGFEILGTIPWDVQTISFDYDVLGHNGEASLSLDVGPWSGIAPLPSTGTVNSGPNFPLNVDLIPSGTPGEGAQGTVTFDFANNTITVTGSTPLRTYPIFTTGLPDSFLLGQGVHDIRLLVSNTAPGSSDLFDANVNSTDGNNAFYRIDNFRITALPTPEPSRAVLLVIAGMAMVVGRRRK